MTLKNKKIAVAFMFLLMMTVLQGCKSVTEYVPDFMKEDKEEDEEKPDILLWDYMKDSQG